MEKLGVLDSGIGGLNIAKNLHKKTDLDIVFLADQKNLPYGDKSKEEMQKILSENINWFLNKNINNILLACNTASTYIDYLREKFPSVTIDSIIEITSKKIKEEDNIMILATKRTVASKEFSRHLNNSPDYLALGGLAKLIENNNKEDIEDYLKEKLKGLSKDKKYLLACTHYPIVKDIFKKVLGAEPIDSINAVVDHYKEAKGEKKLKVYTSSNLKKLRDQIENIFKLKEEVFFYKEAYKIVVVSDNHGHYSPISKVLENNRDAAAFIHCGDVELEPELVSDFYVVSGNNDYSNDYQKNRKVVVGDYLIYVTHGHEHPRYRRLENTYKDAQAIGADIVCFGHEHIFKEAWIEDTLLLNPGSLFYNRDNSPNSYAVIEIENDNINVKRVDLLGSILWAI